MVCFAGVEGSSPDDLAAQMEAAAEQLAAAKRAAEARRREEAITEVEMVLQTYFHNLDNSYNKLQTINEYMDDVEVSHPADSPNPEALTAFSPISTSHSGDLDSGVYGLGFRRGSRTGRFLQMQR